MPALVYPRPTPSKRELAARVASRLGVLRAVRHTRAARGLLVLAYHRIGDPRGCPTDSGVYSTTAAGLSEHLAILRRWSRIISLAEVEALYSSGKTPAEPLSLLTFDDAYRDNYTTAFPILREAGVTGVFFVPTELIGCGHVPWWDRIAHAVKHARVDSCRLGYPGMSLDAIQQRPEAVLRALLERFKSDPELDKERFVRDIEEALGACAIGSPDVAELFATWDELREMLAGGMDLASHTHAHRILAHLPLEAQREELALSRTTLRERLGVDTTAVAYPVGGRGHFNADTYRALRETGYRLGFSHYGGWNPAPADPFDIRRVKVGMEVTSEMLRATAALPSLFAR
jgi:peptidoglycan/xylan/chitin deacetylase (PgdA/CDA1 family)